MTFCRRSPNQCLSRQPENFLEITSTTNCKLGGQKLLLPDSVAFHNTILLPFLAVAYSALTRQAALMVQFHHQAPKLESRRPQDTKYAFSRTFTSSWLQKWKMNHYTFLFQTLKVSFSSKNTALFVCWGECFFSAVNKTLDSEAQATANRKKVYVHALPNTRQSCQYILLTRTTTLSIYHLYLELCVAVTFQSRICFCSLISKRDFKAIKFYWCKHLCIQCILLEYLQMFSLFMNHLVSRNLFEQVFLENEK